MKQEKTGTTKSSSAVRWPSLKMVFVHARHFSFWTGGSHRLELVGQCLFWETAWAGKFSNGIKGSKTRECSGALTSTEDNVTACKTAAYALALPATQRKIPTEVIVPSKLQLFIIYSSECSTTTKFTWLYPCRYKPQSPREKGGSPWWSFAKLEIGGDGLTEFPKTHCTMVRKAYRDFGQACWTLKNHYRASTIFQNLPESEVL